MKRRLLLTLAGMLALGACANQTATYDAKQALLAADTIALRYLAQPPCPAGKTAITCVDPMTKARIKQSSAVVTAARKAYDAAVTAGQKPDDANLTAAIVAFAAVVAPLNIKE